MLDKDPDKKLLLPPLLPIYKLALFCVIPKLSLPLVPEATPLIKIFISLLLYLQVTCCKVDPVVNEALINLVALSFALVKNKCGSLSAPESST